MVKDMQEMMQTDDSKINMSDAWQVLWWCSHLGVTKTQLEQAIVVAGPVIVDLKQYLGSIHALPTDPLPIKPPLIVSHLNNRSTLSRSPF